MPLPTNIQWLLRQYDNSEISWGDYNNSRLMDQLAQFIHNNNLNAYVHSRQFAIDISLFIPIMYTAAQMQNYPSPIPKRICKNAVRCLRRRV